MVVNVQYNGFLPDIILTVDPMSLPAGNPFKCHGNSLSTYKRFDIFPPDGGCLRKGLDAFRYFFKLLGSYL